MIKQSAMQEGVMHVALKLLALVTLVHVVIWSVEFTYYRNCASGLFNSLYTHQSSVCKTMRTLSNTLDGSLSSGLLYVTYTISNLLSKVFGPGLFLGDKRPATVQATTCGTNPPENQSLSALTSQNCELDRSAHTSSAPAVL